jgi:ankyrin repeat protein
MRIEYVYVAMLLTLPLFAMHYSPFGETNLIRAVQHGDVPRAVELLNAGADIEAADYFWRTPFLVAASYGQRTMLLVLCSYGADIFAFDWVGNNALHLAVLNGRLCVIPLLLRFGLDITERNWRGQTPLSIARDTNQVDIDDLLMESQRTGFSFRSPLRLSPIPEEDNERMDNDN